MRLVLSTVMVGALAVCCGGSLLGQHMGGGHHGGAEAPISPSSGVRFFRGGAVAPIGPPPIGLQSPGVGYTGINPGALRGGRSFFGSGEHGNGERWRHRDGYGYFGGGYLYVPYYPYSDYGSVPYNNGYGYGPSDDVSQQSADVTANLLGEQIKQLSAEIQDLKASERGYGPPPQYGPPQGQEYPIPVPAQPDPAAEPITVVLKNGQQIKVQSYAVMDGKFWDFSRQPARRIPLSEIDMAASTKATEATGSEFPELR